MRRLNDQLFPKIKWIILNGRAFCRGPIIKWILKWDIGMRRWHKIRSNRYLIYWIRFFIVSSFSFVISSFFFWLNLAQYQFFGIVGAVESDFDTFNMNCVQSYLVEASIEIEIRKNGNIIRLLNKWYNLTAESIRMGLVSEALVIQN